MNNLSRQFFEVITPLPARRRLLAARMRPHPLRYAANADPGALQYDLRRDHVTRRRQPAYRTFMPTLRKSLGHGRSAYARLTGSARIHLHQLSPGARSLVPELGKERVPSGVVDRAGQYSARKSFDIEIFHCDQPVALHQPAA